MGNRSNINLVGNTTQGQNLSAGDACVFKEKTNGNTLQFRTISSTGDSIQIFQTDEKILISGATGGGSTVISGTANYIPKFNATGDNIEDSFIRDGSISVDLGYETINLGLSTTTGGNRYIKAAGTDSDIWLILCSKGNRSVGVFGDCGLQMGTPSNWLCYNGDCLYKVSYEDFCIHGGDNNNAGITACSLHLRGGDANNATSTGGDLVMCAGNNPLGADGRIKICNLPACTTETCVVYIDASGNLSTGVGGGGTGGGLAWTGSTNNGVGTYSSSGTICSEPNLTFDGTCLVVTGCACATSNMYATDFVLTSDARLKTNIQPILIAPVNVEYKQFEFISEPNRLRYGVIAQELQEINPELVRTDDKGMLSVSYIDMLVKEVASLKCRVCELEKRL